LEEEVKGGEEKVKGGLGLEVERVEEDRVKGGLVVGMEVGEEGWEGRVGRVGRTAEARGIHCHPM
jgi:hypothetical protein